MAFLKKHSSKPESSAQPVRKLSHVPNVLLRPLVSEKANRLQALGQYTFMVAPDTSKIEVKKVIEATYGVRVVGVNSIRLPRKVIRRGRTSGQTRIRHHVVVRLAPGQSINLGGAVT